VTVALTLALAATAFAQTGTINGRVVDQADAVLPGVTVIVTNVNTGIVREAVSNAEGLYSVPGLQPGTYKVSAAMPGFATMTRDGIALPVTATITVDLHLGLAAVQENVTVAGASPVIEVTQSKVSSTIRTQEVQSLPVLTRRFTQLMTMLPGAKEVAPLHPIKRQQGSVSVGGAQGRNIAPLVDGADNRDNLVGGPMMAFTMEGTEEFRVNTHQFTAADGRSGGATVALVTKSGTNDLRGSAFLYDRERALTHKDYFATRDNIPKDPFSRRQYGGSFGGPIIKNNAFFFGALELIRERKSISIPNNVYDQVKLLEPYGAIASHTIPQPYDDHMYTFKVNEQLNASHALMGRFAGQQHTAFEGIKTQRYMSDLSSTTLEETSYWSAVVQHNWVHGSRVLNQLTVHRNHMYGVNDQTGSKGPGQDRSLFFHLNYPDVTRLAATNTMTFPSFSVGNPSTSYDYAQDLWQFKEALTLQLGVHSMRMGADYNWLPTFGGSCCLYWGRFTFFDDPATIVNNTNGRYPQGFQTPGAVRNWAEGADIRTNLYRVDGAKKVAAYVQDDWRLGPRLTLNLGVRYDRDINFYDQSQNENNLTYQLLKDIGSPYAQLPKTPTKDISPRVGFAYDIAGNGKRVVRGGYGLYFDGTGINTHYNIFILGNRPITFDATAVNTAVGVGQLATYRFGIDPPPEKPTITDRFPPGKRSGGYWFDPEITDPRTHQAHIGYTQEMLTNAVFSVDYTHIEGLHDFRVNEANPLINGVRLLAPQLQAVYGDPDRIGPLQIQRSNNKNRYDELAFLFEKRMRRATIRATYTLAGTYAYGGQIAGSAYFTPAPSTWNQPFGPGEWGPTNTDERHRVVLFGVFDLPFGIQASPVLKMASARPYNLVSGFDTVGLSVGSGGLVERYVDPATGQQVSAYSARGDNTTLMDMRVTKFLQLGDGHRRIGLFAEFFNLFNTVNFGEQYNGNARSVLFRQPVGYLAGGYGTYPFLVQLGARLEF
jgi:hypothetical protein